MKKVIFTIWVVLVAVSTHAQTTETIKDPRDGKTYKTVTIGTQVWMAENLNFETTEGSWCYKNQAANCQKYGRLYNYTTVQIVCPTGWHLPTYTEYDALKTYVGGEVAGFSKLKKGGSTGFNAVLSGWCINGSQDRDEYVKHNKN